MTFYIKQNDTSPALRRTLSTSDGAINLTGAVVRFHMTKRPGVDPLKVDAVATIVSAAEGVVEYPWSVGDTDTAGNFEAEFEITFADGSVETVPNTENIRISIFADLG